MTETRVVSCEDSGSPLQCRTDSLLGVVVSSEWHDDDGGRLIVECKKDKTIYARYQEGEVGDWIPIAVRRMSSLMSGEIDCMTGPREEEMVQGVEGRFCNVEDGRRQRGCHEVRLACFEKDGIDRWTKQRKGNESKERRKRRSFV
jgi:hypothetical protein